MDDTLDTLVARLEEFGLRVEASERSRGVNDGYDVDLLLSRGEARQEFAMELMGHARLSDLGRHSGVRTPAFPWMVGAASVSSRSADAFRRAGVQYIDASGNASIHFGDVLIDVRGRRVGRDLSTPPGRGNLFSSARAQVAFALLQWPRLWQKPQREIAEAAGVSLGQVNDALKLFREAGFGPGGHRSHSEFLDLWVASFPSGLGHKLVLATYRGSIEDFSKIDVEDPTFVGAEISGELAADDLLRPAALTVYVANLDPLFPVANRWRSDGDGNITVKRKFWRTPKDEMPARPPVDMRQAPPVLVYADLLASGDPRVRSVAPDWRNRQLSM
ncbi:MAG: type IV toxin-antitoxin system AbiEi family antitoxin [Propionibacteriaceae bacterium]